MQATLSESQILEAEILIENSIFAELNRDGKIKYYNGSYESLPSTEDQIYATNGQTMEKDFKVLAMPIGLATISQINSLF